MTQVSDFVRESHRIDQQIWDALCLRSGDAVLWCGLPDDRAWIDRAVEIGASLTLIEGDTERVGEAEAAGYRVLRGSTTMIPAKPDTFDVAVAFHYLHEIDPSFHAQVAGELARVARRIAVVEPAPPADVLGRRIAQLYAMAKREMGSFENYQPVEYWRKLLAIVKADVVLETLTFRRIPPKHAVEETVRLVLHAMATEDLPEGYLEELRALARRPDAQLLPLSRYVIIGAAAGEIPATGPGTKFRPNEVLEAPAPPPPAPLPVPVAAAPPVAVPPAVTEWTPPEMEPEIPEVPRPFRPSEVAAAAVFGAGPDLEDDLDVAEAAGAPAPPPPPQQRPRRRGKPTPILNPPGAEEPPPAPSDEPPFGAPFAVPLDLDPFAEPGSNPMPRYGEPNEAFGTDDATADPFGHAAAPKAPSPGWSWEPPEDEHPA